VIFQGRLLFLGTVEQLRSRLSRDESLEQLFLALTEEAAGDGGDRE
jgi:hypothetical protein